MSTPTQHNKLSHPCPPIEHRAKVRGLTGIQKALYRNPRLLPRQVPNSHRQSLPVADLSKVPDQETGPDRFLKGQAWRCDGRRSKKDGEDGMGDGVRLRGGARSRMERAGMWAARYIDESSVFVLRSNGVPARRIENGIATSQRAGVKEAIPFLLRGAMDKKNRTRRDGTALAMLANEPSVCLPHSSNSSHALLFAPSTSHITFTPSRSSRLIYELSLSAEA